MVKKIRGTPRLRRRRELPGILALRERRPVVIVDWESKVFREDWRRAEELIVQTRQG